MLPQGIAHVGQRSALDLRPHRQFYRRHYLRLHPADGGHHLQHLFFGRSSMQMVSLGAKCHHARPVDSWHRRFHCRQAAVERHGQIFDVIRSKREERPVVRRLQVAAASLSEDRSDELQIAEAGRPALEPAQAHRA